ncbi:MAG: hypothetical protein ACKOEC_16560 [Acidimicrobiia bacterium]
MQTPILRLATALVVLLWAQSTAAQTADEVIEKSIAAMGGRAALEKVQSRQMTGTLAIGTPAGDIQGTIEILNAVPNTARTVIKADLSAFGAGPMLIDQRFDGTKGYVIDTLQGDREITGQQLDTMKANAFPHPFLNYKAQGASVQLSGKEKVLDKDAFVLVFQPPSGPPIKQYVDATTFMPLRTVIKATVPQFGEVEQNADPSDYRDLDGVKVPYKLQIQSSVQGLTMTFTKIEQNVTVDEKLFVKQ